MSCPAGPLRGRLSAHEDDGKPDAYPTIRCWWRLPSGILILLLTDDGSAGEKGLVTEPLKKLCESQKIDEVVAIGPPIMMKFCAATTEPFKVPTTVSLNTIMIDGTGMCGGCRVTIGGKTKFVCVDGPEFDAHQVDFDEMLMRLSSYKEVE